MSRTVVEIQPPKPFREMTPRELMAFRDEWEPKGNCYRGDPDIFFPREGGVPEPAKTICEGGMLDGEQHDMIPDGIKMEIQTCPVKNTCLVWARLTKQPNGIWGGVRFDRPSPKKGKKK